MFKLCHFKEHPEVKFILFHNEDFTVDDFKMEVEEELSLNDNFEFTNQVANHYAILSYSDLVIRTINHKIRTVSDRLDAIHIRCLADIVCENTLIQLKKSKLSKSQRDLVQFRYNEIKCLISDTTISSQ